MADLRKHPRVSLSAKVLLETAEGVSERWSENLSVGGIFIAMAQPLPLATAVRVTVIQMPASETLFSAAGTVAWIRPKVGFDSVPSGIGIEFTELSDASRAVIERIVADRSA
jgi:uncharacterized protein (TIGR02266 family)